MNTIKHLSEHTGLPWVITAAWLALLTIAVVQPESQPIIQTGIPPAPPSLQRELLFASLHIITFSITTALWIAALSSHMALRSAICLAAIIVFSYGVLLEYLQSYTTRSVQLTDVIANGIGIALCCGLVYREAEN